MSNAPCLKCANLPYIPPSYICPNVGCRYHVATRDYNFKGRLADPMTAMKLVVDLGAAIEADERVNGRDHIALFSELMIRAKQVPQAFGAEVSPRERFNVGESWRRNGKRKGAGR